MASESHPALCRNNSLTVFACGTMYTEETKTLRVKGELKFLHKKNNFLVMIYKTQSSRQPRMVGKSWREVFMLMLIKECL
jgi:hypothetical protein